MDLSQEVWDAKQEATPNGIILDVRTQEEFEEGHIPKAQLLDIRKPQEFMNKINDLNADESYFVYCRSGSRSAQACQLMKQSGIQNCYNLLGGILEWQGAVE